MYPSQRTSIISFKKNLTYIEYNVGPIAAIVEEINVSAAALDKENTVTTN